MFNFRKRGAVLAAAAITMTGALALSGCAAGGAGSDGSGAADPNEKVTLNFTWWGNDDRAARYKQAIALFEEENPNITINGTFTDYPSYWEKRQTEAAGGGLPDVMQFDYTYLRQYGDNGLLLDLSDHFGDTISTDAINETLLRTGELDDGTFAIPTGYSAWAMFQNTELLDSVGAKPFAGGSWADYDAYMKSVTDASGGSVYGGTDYTQRIQSFELQLRQDGKELFDANGEFGFTEADLAAYWKSGAPLLNGVTIPQSKLEEINPISGFGAKLATSELSWSNFLGGYISESGTEAITLVAPPTSDKSAKDLFQKVGLMQAVSASTKHPEAAATFVDFLINSPDFGKIFGATLGIPASATQLAGADLQGPDKAVQDYLISVEDRIGEAPAAPVAGYGSIEQTFWDLGKSIGLGAISIDDAVAQFFDEASVVLG